MFLSNIVFLESIWSQQIPLLLIFSWIVVDFSQSQRVCLLSYRHCLGSRRAVMSSSAISLRNCSWTCHWKLAVLVGIPELHLWDSKLGHMWQNNNKSDVNPVIITCNIVQIYWRKFAPCSVKQVIFSWFNHFQTAESRHFHGRAERGVVSLKVTIQQTIFYLETFSVDNGWPLFFVFGSGNP